MGARARLPLITARRKPLMYIGPETMMPLASALAAIAGVVLMFWRRFVGFIRMTSQAASRTISRIFVSR